MKVGMIGLGIMGFPMAKNLLRAGHELVIVEGHAKAAVEELRAQAETVSTPAEVGERVDILITMVQDVPQTTKVLFGPNGAADTMKPGSIVIDCSSVSPAASRGLSARLAQKGIDLLDAPVSGGETGAIQGTLAFMVGGKQSAFDRVCPLFEAMGGSHILCGGSGAGSTAKLCNQIIVAVNMGAVAEALTLGQSCGVEPDKIREAIRGGLAGSAVLEAKAPKMMDRDFVPGGRLELHIKDLSNVVSTAAEVNSPTPITQQLLEMMKILRRAGEEKNDHAVVSKFYELLTGMELHR